MKTLNLEITFDDKAVEKWFEEKGMKQAVDKAQAELVKRAEQAVVDTGHTKTVGWGHKPDWEGWLREVFEDAAMDHRDEVIELAAAALARKTKQSQKYRDIVRILMEERKADASDDSIQ